MAGSLLPTTRAQVSGHRFLRRRVEHGLMFGDIRMIHDPLTARTRAAILGTVAVALIAALSGLLAWLNPNAHPGDAPVVRSSQGALFVRIDDHLHPVTNLTSARLIAGSPEEPARIGDDHLAQELRGVPVGITAAPSLFAPDDEVPLQWSVCHEQVAGTVTVHAGDALVPLPADEAVVAAVGAEEWLVTGQSRALLPSATSPDGRAIRRVLGISADTPRWEPPAEVLSVIDEAAPIAPPDPLPEVVQSEGSAWILLDTGGLQRITEAQRDMLLDAGASRREVPRENMAAYPDAVQPLALRLPERVPVIVDTRATALCATPRGAGRPATTDVEATRLSGDSVATHFHGLATGAVGVDTGHGLHVVSAAGQRHPVPSGETFELVGAQRVEQVEWRIIALLPEGEELSRDSAIVATY